MGWDGIKGRGEALSGAQRNYSYHQTGANHHAGKVYCSNDDLHFYIKAEQERYGGQCILEDRLWVGESYTFRKTNTE